LDLTQVNDFPTPGWITMNDAFRQMELRFSEINPYFRDTLRAMKLLIFAGILPLTQDRIQFVLEGIFHSISGDHNIRTTLEHLADQDYIAKPGAQDPIQPEYAYLLYCVHYVQGQSIQEDTIAIHQDLRTLVDVLDKP